MPVLLGLSDVCVGDVQKNQYVANICQLHSSHKIS